MYTVYTSCVSYSIYVFLRYICSVNLGTSRQFIMMGSSPKNVLLNLLVLTFIALKGKLSISPESGGERAVNFTYFRHQKN